MILKINYRWLPIILIGIAIIAAQCGVTPAPEGAASAIQKGTPKVMIIDPWTRPSPTGAGNGAIYMTLMNEGEQADVLLSVETEVAEAAELHESKLEGDVMKMSPISSIEIPSGGSVSLEPGGKHIMLINLKQPLTLGEKVPLLLNFEKSGSLTVEAEIREGGK